MFKNNDVCVFSQEGYPSIYMDKKGFYIQYADYTTVQCGQNFNVALQKINTDWY